MRGSKGFTRPAAPGDVQALGPGPILLALPELVRVPHHLNQPWADAHERVNISKTRDGDVTIQEFEGRDLTGLRNCRLAFGGSLKVKTGERRSKTVSFLYQSLSITLKLINCIEVITWASLTNNMVCGKTWGRTVRKNIWDSIIEVLEVWKSTVMHSWDNKNFIQKVHSPFGLGRSKLGEHFYKMLAWNRGGKLSMARCD